DRDSIHLRRATARVPPRDCIMYPYMMQQRAYQRAYLRQMASRDAALEEQAYRQQAYQQQAYQQQAY
ncbi:hypothetical protein LTR48_009506, partial [Friedmanniomyces endolithicus]